MYFINRTFPGLPARPGFCQSVTTINKTPRTSFSKQSSIHYHPSKTTQHGNCIQCENNIPEEIAPQENQAKEMQQPLSNFQDRQSYRNNFLNKPIWWANTPETAEKAKHWVYKWSRAHMTLEEAIHVVQHSSPKADNNIHDGWESTIWSTESNRKLQQGMQLGMCRPRPCNSSIKSWFWDFPWLSGLTGFLPNNQKIYIYSRFRTRHQGIGIHYTATIWSNQVQIKCSHPSL